MIEHYDLELQDHADAYAYDDWNTYEANIEQEEAQEREEVLNAWNARKIHRESSAFKSLGQKWTDSRLGSKGWIGACMKQISAAQPADYFEWWNTFMDNSTPNANGALYTGFERMERTGRAWNTLNPTMDAGTAWNHAVIHAIDESWDGYQRELRVQAKLQQLLNTMGGDAVVERVHHSFDDLYRIDLVITRPQEDGRLGPRPLLGLQVKPLSYFETTRVPAWQKEATRAAHIQLQHLDGYPTAFIAEHPRTFELSLWTDRQDKDGTITYTCKAQEELPRIPLAI